MLISSKISIMDIHFWCFKIKMNILSTQKVLCDK